MNDQSFIGYSKESAPRGNQWVSAVNSTDVDSGTSLIITYKKQPIDVYFFSSSGGYTQRSQDVWGTTIPYLQSLPDPWSISDKLNPGYAHWIRAYSYATVSSVLGMPDLTRMALSGKTVAGANVKVVAYGAAGEKKVFSISSFKSLVHLPSSWFTIQVQYGDGINN
jgi:stage II sporulation protein D